RSVSPPTKPSGRLPCRCGRFRRGPDWAPTSRLACGPPQHRRRNPRSGIGSPGGGRGGGGGVLGGGWGGGEMGRGRRGGPAGRRSIVGATRAVGSARGVLAAGQ